MNLSVESTYSINENETFELPMSLYQPWSMPVMKLTLPTKILNLMIGLSDAILEKGSSQSWGRQLAGQIEQETLIPVEILERAGLAGFFGNVVRQYILQCLRQSDGLSAAAVIRQEFRSYISQMWVVSQLENEYNPTHSHRNFDVAGVMYLKMPKMQPSRKAHRLEDDGSIIFYGGYSGDAKLSTPTLQIKPVVGDLYLFSAHQLHSVYPFRCPEGEIETERRSISFNAVFEQVPSAAKDRSCQV